MGELLEDHAWCAVCEKVGVGSSVAVGALGVTASGVDIEAASDDEAPGKFADVDDVVWTSVWSVGCVYCASLVAVAASVGCER